MTEAQYLLALFACHHIGDFGFQSAWMAEMKRTNLEVLAYHVFAQASPFIVFMFVPGAHVTALGIVLHMALHAIVDALKGDYFRKGGVIKSIWQDQLCHYACTAFEHAIGVL